MNQAMEANQTQDESKSRGKPSAARPWCWCEKGALEMIRTYLEDNHGHSAFALSTYVALSECASDAQSDRFTVPISQIARRAGASYRTTADILNRLESLRLIRVQRNSVPGTKEHAPSTYTMLGTPCLTLGKREASCLPKGIKNKKNKKKALPFKKGDTHLLRKSASPSDFDEDGFLSEEEREAITYYNRELTPLGFVPVTKVSPALEKALEVFSGDDIHRLVDAVLEDDGSIPRRKTLVRLLWNNH